MNGGGFYPNGGFYPLPSTSFILALVATDWLDVAAVSALSTTPASACLATGGTIGGP